MLSDCQHKATAEDQEGKYHLYTAGEETKAQRHDFSQTYRAHNWEGLH